MSIKETRLDIRQKRGARDVNKRDWARYSTKKRGTRDVNNRDWARYSTEDTVYAQGMTTKER